MKARGREVVTAMIPARMGSTRLAMKNLALICGKPLIYYAIKAAKDSGAFDRVVINSEDDVFAAVAKRYGVGFYKRPPEWASSAAKSDFVVYDFIMKNPCDIVAWVNPTSPLAGAEEVADVVGYFRKERLDSLITVADEQVHCVYKDEPVNFDKEGVFAKTQDLAPVRRFVYSVMMWRADVFRKEFEKKGSAFFCGRTGFYPVSKASAVIIKRPEDLMLAEGLMKAAAGKGGHKVKYDPLVRRRGGKRRKR